MTAPNIVKALRGIALYARHGEACPARGANDDAACVCGFSQASRNLALAVIDAFQDHIVNLPDSVDA